MHDPSHDEQQAGREELVPGVGGDDGDDDADPGHRDDGERLAFWSVSDECILFVMTLKDSQNREIYRLKDEDFGGLAWSSDSHRIYFVRRNFEEKKYEIWQIPAEGGEPQAIGLLASPITQIGIHPAGKKIAYSINELKVEKWVMENFLPEKESAQK